jgi:hypothetical protein
MMRALYVAMAIVSSIMLSALAHQIEANWVLRIVFYVLFVSPWILLFYKEGSLK